jgi:hypothetical protein
MPEKIPLPQADEEPKIEVVIPEYPEAEAKLRRGQGEQKFNEESILETLTSIEARLAKATPTQAIALQTRMERLKQKLRQAGTWKEKPEQ